MIRQTPKPRSHRLPHYQDLKHCVFFTAEGKKIDKLRYKDKRMAVDFLHKFENVSKHQLEVYGQTNRHEARVYKCDRCRGWHTTSRAEYTLGA